MAKTTKTAQVNNVATGEEIILDGQYIERMKPEFDAILLLREEQRQTSNKVGVRRVRLGAYAEKLFSEHGKKSATVLREIYGDEYKNEEAKKIIDNSYLRECAEMEFLSRANPYFSKCTENRMKAFLRLTVTNKPDQWNGVKWDAEAQSAGLPALFTEWGAKIMSASAREISEAFSINDVQSFTGGNVVPTLVHLAIQDVGGNLTFAPGEKFNKKLSTITDKIHTQFDVDATMLLVNALQKRIQAVKAQLAGSAAVPVSTPLDAMETVEA